MGISSLNHFSVVLLVLLSLTGAYASRTLVDSNVSEKNDDSMKKTMMVDQKCNGGGRPTCPGQGSGNCQCQGSSNCPGQGSGNCGGQCQGSGNCADQCQGSCSGCAGYSSCCVQYVPICQVPCACARGNSGGGYAYGNEKWKKIEGPRGTHVLMFPTNGAMTQVNNGVDNEAHVVKPKEIDEERNQSPNESTNEGMTRKVDTLNSEVHNEAHFHMVSTNGAMTQVNSGVDNEAPIVKPKERNQSPSESTNEGMTRKVDTLNSEVHNEAQFHMVSTNGAMTNGADMANNGLHGESDVATVGEPVKPSMGDEVFH